MLVNWYFHTVFTQNGHRYCVGYSQKHTFTIFLLSLSMKLSLLTGTLTPFSHKIGITIMSGILKNIVLPTVPPLEKCACLCLVPPLEKCTLLLPLLENCTLLYPVPPRKMYPFVPCTLYFGRLYPFLPCTH